MPSARGFTLIELMVVLTVLAILAAVGTPSMTRFMAAQRVRSMATDLHLALVQARSEAIKRNREVAVSPAGGDWNAGWSVLDPENSGGAPLRIYEPASGVRVTQTEPATALPAVVYAGSGRTTLIQEVAFRVDSERTGLARCVRVSLAGRPYVKEAATC